jgi:hypothetical protein
MNPHLLYVTMLGIFLGTMTSANQMMLVPPGAVICDNPEEVEAMLLLNEDSTTMRMVEGCGYLQQPMPAVVEELETVTGKRTRLTVVRLTFPFGVQYGYRNFSVLPPEL